MKHFILWSYQLSKVNAPTYKPKVRCWIKRLPLVKPRNKNTYYRESFIASFQEINIPSRSNQINAYFLDKI